MNSFTVNVEMVTSHCNWYFDLIHAMACFIEVIHLIFGNITQVLFHVVSASNTQLVLGSICKKAFSIVLLEDGDFNEIT